MLYRERVRAPLVWWVLAGLFALSLLVAVGFYLGPVWGIGSGLAVMVVAGTGFTSGAFTLRVDAEGIHVGRAYIEHEYVAGCVALDKDATIVRSGVQADARAHLSLRAYVPTSVEIVLDDPADPVPYWLVSSRRPEQFVAAVERAAAARLGG